MAVALGNNRHEQLPHRDGALIKRRPLQVGVFTAEATAHGMCNIGCHETHTKPHLTSATPDEHDTSSTRDRMSEVPLIRVTSRSRIHVVVIFGGESAEHDVSCVTAAHVLRALDPERYDVTTIAISRAGQWMLAD